MKRYCQCGRPIKAVVNGRYKRPRVDHDLCPRCWASIKDSKRLLTREETK